MPPQERKRRRRRIVLALGIVLLALVGAAAAFVVTREEGDVSNPDVEFRDEPSATPERRAGARGAGQEDRPGRPLHLGRTTATRATAAATCRSKNPPRPPFKEIWQYQGHVLLEFPPVIGGKRLYLLNDNGKLLAIQQAHRQGAVEAQARRPGRRLAGLRGRDRLRRPAPARARTAAARARGRVVALDGKTGKIRWSRELASRSESSPLVADDRLYFGSENGTVYAMGAGDGARALALPRRRARSRAGSRWPTAGSTSATTAGASTRSAQDSGRQVWRASTHGAPLRPRRGQLLLDAGRRVRARLPRQHRRPDLLVLGGQRAAGLEQEHRRLRLRLARRGAGAGRAADSSTSAPTAAASTRSTRAAAPCAGRAAATAGSPAAPA